MVQLSHPDRFIFRAISKKEYDNLEHGDGYIKAKKRNRDREIDMDDAVGTNMRSKWIPFTKNLYVALYFAEEYSRNNNSGHQIIAVDTERIKNDGCIVTDVSDGSHMFAGKSKNFAKKHQIVLVEGSVHVSDMVHRVDTDSYSYLIDADNRSFDNFIDDLDFSVSQDLAREFANHIPPFVTNDGNSRGLSSSRWMEEHGAFKRVVGGKYTRGRRAGYGQAVKYAINDTVKSDVFWQDDINGVEKAEKIIRVFNQQVLKTWNVEVLMNRSSVWEMEKTKEKILCEPMILDFEKFNSNSGYDSEDEFMTALSHFSYHYTKGDYLLADLQGERRVVTVHGKATYFYILTDPVIMSSSRTSANQKSSYGAGDLGKKGIENFFYYHNCTGRLCKNNWKKCRGQRHFSNVRGSMALTTDYYGRDAVAYDNCLDVIGEEDEYDYSD